MNVEKFLTSEAEPKIAGTENILRTEPRIVFHGGFLDEGEAAHRLEEWLGKLAPKVGISGRIDRYGLRIPGPGKETAMPDGGVVNLWGQRGLVGQATVVRTPFNRSVLTIMEFCSVTGDDDDDAERV